MRAILSEGVFCVYFCASFQRTYTYVYCISLGVVIVLGYVSMG